MRLRATQIWPEFMKAAVTIWFDNIISPWHINGVTIFGIKPYLWGDSFNVDISADDCRIVTSPKIVSVEIKAIYWESYNSRVTRFSVLLQLSITLLPVAVEPVKLTLSMSG